MQINLYRHFRPAQALLICALAATLAGCGSTPHRAPVEDRTVGAAKGAPANSAQPGQVASTPVDPKTLPGAENAGKPGYYTVKPGDTLIRIALDNGQNWRDLVKWNSLDKPNLIEVGQVLRVVQPGIDPSSVATRPITTAKVETRPLDSKPGSAASAASAPASAAAPAVAAASIAAPASASRDSDDEPAWGWPAAGTVTAGFDEQRN